ncbi:MAG: membrane dipeptidase [Planctomycetota bacterium]|jgi:membrane dipeptidase
MLSHNLRALLAFIFAASVATSSLASEEERVLVQVGERIVILADDGNIEWEMPWGATRQLHELPNGNLMVQRGASEVVVIEPTSKSVVWSFDAGATLQSFEPLPNGDVWIVAGDPILAYRVNRLGRRKPNATLAGLGALGGASVLDNGPEKDLMARARRLHREVLTLDTHKDISIELASTELPDDPITAEKTVLANDPTVWGTNQVDFPKMIAGGLDCAFYIVYVGQGSLDVAGFKHAREQANSKFVAIERMLAQYPEHIELARTPEDVRRIRAAGKLVCCIGIENGYAMGEDLSAIAEFHRRGARYMSITHNRHSQLGDSNTPEGEPLHGGLSELGRRAIREMNRVGILVDISHAGPITTLQAIEHSKAPVIASHSGVDAVRLHGRNLSDAELQALKQNGGVLQCVAFASYVKGDADRDEFVRMARLELGVDRPAGSPPEDNAVTREKRRALRERVSAYDATAERANVADFADHIDHAVHVMGIEHVAISSDFDGGGGIEGWDDASETFNVTLELVRRGYSDEEIAKLWSGNTLRIWAEAERIAKELAAE